MTDKTMRRSASVPKDAFSGTLDEKAFLVSLSGLQRATYAVLKQKIVEDAVEKRTACECGATIKDTTIYAKCLRCNQHQLEAQFEKGKTAGQSTKCKCIVGDTSATRCGCYLAGQQSMCDTGFAKEMDEQYGKGRDFERKEVEMLFKNHMDGSDYGHNEHCQYCKLKQAGRDEHGYCLEGSLDQITFPCKGYPVICVKHYDKMREKLAALEAKLKEKDALIQGGKIVECPFQKQGNCSFIAALSKEKEALEALFNESGEPSRLKMLKEIRRIGGECARLQKEKDALEAENKQLKAKEGLLPSTYECTEKSEHAPTLYKIMCYRCYEDLKVECARLRDALESVVNPKSSLEFARAREKAKKALEAKK